MITLNTTCAEQISSIENDDDLVIENDDDDIIDN